MPKLNPFFDAALEKTAGPYDPSRAFGFNSSMPGAPVQPQGSGPWSYTIHPAPETASAQPQSALGWIGNKLQSLTGLGTPAPEEPNHTSFMQAGAGGLDSLSKMPAPPGMRVSGMITGADGVHRMRYAPLSGAVDDPRGDYAVTGQAANLAAKGQFPSYLAQGAPAPAPTPTPAAKPQGAWGDMLTSMKSIGDRFHTAYGQGSQLAQQAYVDTKSFLKQNVGGPLERLAANLPQFGVSDFSGRDLVGLAGAAHRGDPEAKKHMQTMIAMAQDDKDRAALQNVFGR